MTIVRYDPFRDLRTLQEEVNRLFSTNLTRGFGEEGIGRGAWNPSVDIYENKDHIVLEAELPGMHGGDVEVYVTAGNQLTVLSPTGVPTLIRDIGRVTIGPEIRRGVVDLDGIGDTAGGIVVMRHGENALNVIERVKKKIVERKKVFATTLADGKVTVPALCWKVVLVVDRGHERL